MSYSNYVLNERISNIQATISPIVPSPAPGQLIVVDTIIVADVFPSPTQTAILSSSQLSFIDSATTNISSLDDTQILMSSTATLNSVDIKNNAITLTDASGTNLLTAAEWTGNIKTVNSTQNLTHYPIFSDSSGTGYGHPQKNASISCNPSTGTLTASTFVGSLTGNASSATNASIVGVSNDNTSTARFITFAAGLGNQALKIDITTGPLTYVPSTGTLTASIFEGSATTVALTPDDTSGTYSIPFSKTTTATGNALFIDNTTTPLTYNPLSSTLTALVFSGSATTTAITDTNTNSTFYPVFVSGSGSGQTLRADITISPFSYNPLTALLTVNNLALLTSASTVTFAGTTLTVNGASYTFRNFDWLVTGTTNTVNTLVITTGRVNGVYNVCIINNGSGALTINNTGLGLNTLCKYTSPVVVLPNNLAVMTIKLFTVNTITRIIVDCYNVSP